MFEHTGDAVGDTDFIGGYGVPMDPMDLLQCDSCQ
ncbi:ribonucleotide-diphosphate reductase subunit beta [Amnibacterium kyonggiense]